MSEQGPEHVDQHLLAPDSSGPQPGQPWINQQADISPPPYPSLPQGSDNSLCMDQREPTERHSRSTSTGAGEPRSRSRSPRTRRYGASGTITEIPQRSRSPTPTRMHHDGFAIVGCSPNRNHIIARGMYSLSPPEITYDEVSTAPNSPTEGIMLQDYRMFGSSHQLHNKAVMVTPSGSLLAVNQSPLELRESTLTVNYPDTGDDGDEVSLLYSRHEKIPMKDFAAEIRASLDVENFLSQAQLILDMSEHNMESIIDKLLNHLLVQEEPSSTIIEEAKKSLFTHDSVHQLAKTIQGTCNSYGGGFDYDQSWVSVLCTVPSAQKRHVAIARLKSPANLGRTSQEVYFIILVVTPSKEKGTKNALETGRTFATLFSDIDLRLRLLAARSEEEFKHLMWEHMKELAEEQNGTRKMSSSSSGDRNSDTHCGENNKQKCLFAKGLRTDFWRRIGFYISDFKDGFVEPKFSSRHGFVGHRTIQKTASTTIFLYFACILPSIALGVLNDNNTHGHIDVMSTIYAQTFGGLFFAFFGGQPMVILLTTAPLALFTKVIYTICEEWNLDFQAMYSCTGLWNSFFLLIYAFSDASRLMKWSTRSTEEIFSLFISLAFAVDAFKDVWQDFGLNYHTPACFAEDAIPSTGNESMVTTALNLVTESVLSNVTSEAEKGFARECNRQHSLLYLLLMLGTVWLGMSIYNFTKTPFLNSSKRELLADYALPVSVLVMSFFGSYLFKAIELEPFHYDGAREFKGAPLQTLPWMAVLGSMGMGFCLSLLFFMDQNISEAMVNSPDNKMKKGGAYHWDLLVVAVINAVFTYLGLPMIHGALPHSPLHVRAMADVEDRVDQGHVYQKIMYVRETRVTGIFAHILIGLSLFLLPYPLAYIPRAVLDGLFLYLAVTALNNNQLAERIMLLVTEQAAYPPNHYIRSVPQRKVHLFTFTQLLQLAVMCGFGFAPLSYLKMVFPVLILLLLPVRHKLTPLLIDKKYLEALDASH